MAKGAKFLKSVFVLELVASQRTTFRKASDGITEKWSLFVHLCHIRIKCGAVTRVQIKNTSIAHLLTGLNILEFSKAGTMLYNIAIVFLDNSSTCILLMHLARTRQAGLEDMKETTSGSGSEISHLLSQTGHQMSHNLRTVPRLMLGLRNTSERHAQKGSLLFACMTIY